MLSKIHKTDAGHNTVTFVVLEPDTEDRNGDIISEDEVIKTAHEFMINLSEKKINVDHEEDTDIDENEAKFVESFITPTVIQISDTEEIKKGSWMVAIKFSDELFKKIVDGEIVGISMEGEGLTE